MKSQGKYIFDQYKKKIDQKSFTDLFDSYYSQLKQFAFTIVQSEIIADEVVLDVFMKLWEQKDSVKKINNIETYLFVSVRNTSINSIKRGQKFHFDMLTDSHIQLADYKATVENSIIEEEMLDELNKAVTELPAKCKIIFKLIREDGLNRNEAAEILNVSVKTIDNQVAIAVRKIAERLNIDLSNPGNSKNLMSFLLVF